MSIHCPKCNSHRIDTLNYGKKAGSAIGTAAGAASGAASAYSGDQIGARFGAVAGPAHINATIRQSLTISPASLNIARYQAIKVFDKNTNY